MAPQMDLTTDPLARCPMRYGGLVPAGLSPLLSIDHYFAIGTAVCNPIRREVGDPV